MAASEKPRYLGRIVTVHEIVEDPDMADWVGEKDRDGLVFDLETGEDGVPRIFVLTDDVPTHSKLIENWPIRNS